jgi:hypothetical protein
MARRWMDAEILGKIGLGAVLIGVSTVLWFMGRVWPWGWVVGVGSLLWGVFSIGDKKNEWE